jgi:hypothetical protein
MPIHARLDIQANFAAMLVGFLILERFDNLAQREMTINNRAHAISIDGSDHILLLAAAVFTFGRYPLVSLYDQFPRYVEKP